MKKPEWARLADEAFKKADEAFAIADAAFGAVTESEATKIEVPEAGTIVRFKAPTWWARLRLAFKIIFTGKITGRIRPKR